MSGIEALMPSEERDAEMLGWPKWRRWEEDTGDGSGYVWGDGAAVNPGEEPGRWHADPVAQAMVEVVEAARAYRAFAQPRQHTMTPETIAEWHRVKDAFYTALDNLDAALGGGRNG